MAEAKSLTPPSPGLSATLHPIKRVESYSPKEPENVKKKKNNNTKSMYEETVPSNLLSPKRIII